VGMILETTFKSPSPSTFLVSLRTVAGVGMILETTFKSLPPPPQQATIHMYLGRPESKDTNAIKFLKSVY
jgi:hypothetical protein